jgi:hypothetical protein
LATDPTAVLVTCRSRFFPFIGTIGMFGCDDEDDDDDEMVADNDL